MKTFSSFLRPAILLAALPAALAFSACSDDDNSADPVPDRGQIQLVHAAPYNKVKVDLLADDSKLAEAEYGKVSGYQNVNAGNRAVKIKASATQADVVTPFSLSVPKDKRYSVYVYNPTASTVGYLSVEDDLTAPASGQAKVRFVNLGYEAGSITLLPQGSGAQPIASGVTSGQFSPTYTTVEPRVYVLEARQAGGQNNTLTSKSVKFESNKIYTVLLRGRNSQAVPADEQLSLELLTNN